MSPKLRGPLLLVVGLVSVVAGGYALRDRLGIASVVSRYISVFRRPGGAISSSAGRSGEAPPLSSQPAGREDATARSAVSIDLRRQQLIGVRTVTVTRSTMAPAVRTVGIVRYDETRQTDVNVKLDGWIRDLYVDFTGQRVVNGQPLFTLYSPDLLAAENEYLLALSTRDQLRQSEIADARERAEQLVASARQRLALWDLSEEEIRALETRRRAEAAVTFRSPADGFVVEKQAVKGMHVAAGQTLYRVADLSVVWIEADIYESDLPLVRVGGRAVVTLDAYPNDRLQGRAVYIYPYVDEKTRTDKVRYEFANAAGRLKPGMFANVEIASVSAPALVVPGDAVLDTGREQIVFVAKGGGVFEPRRVKTGRRTADEIQIVAGVEEGDQVASGATFFLDSESQLRAAIDAYDEPAASPAVGAPAPQLEIEFRTLPDPPQSGENQFEVVATDRAGGPLEGAEVDVLLFMPAMPAMNMPAARSDVKLQAAGRGVYRGTGRILSAGRWETTVTVRRGGQVLGSRHLPLTTR